ncbi:hypothetical protein HK100_000249 [Physocladia obscura]|uniref:Uncharacterized protein n=1 Tax=Physocladia obscura TaxID=109957 RepID=A0AAD5SZL3_9FUNG|nr:hypothetical protein HK100_000249 [Physocladia obscura]
MLVAFRQNPSAIKTSQPFQKCLASAKSTTRIAQAVAITYSNSNFLSMPNSVTKAALIDSSIVHKLVSLFLDDVGVDSWLLRACRADFEWNLEALRAESGEIWISAFERLMRWKDSNAETCREAVKFEGIDENDAAYLREAISGIMQFKIIHPTPYGQILQRNLDDMLENLKLE